MTIPRALWVEENNDLDVVKAKRNLITAAYFSIKDPRVTKGYLERVRDQGFKVGIYACAQGDGWPQQRNGVTGRAWADWVHQKLNGCDLGRVDQPMVHLNAEVDDANWVKAMLLRWRAHRPTRVTSWTMEGHKAELFKPIIQTIRDVRVEVLPQAYSGSMRRWESDAITHEWIAAGVPHDRVAPFLSAAELGDWWRGAAFIQGTLV